jgi:hypothetical protein
MKRLIFAIVTAFLLTITIVIVAPPYRQAEANSPDINVLLDGLPVRFDVPPQITDGRTLVPFRFIAEALNISVNWDGNTRTISASDGEIQVLLQINNRTAHVNGSASPLDAAPVIVAGRTLIPLRFFSEAFGCQVEWVRESRTVKITSPPKTMTVAGFYALGDARTSSWANLFGVSFPATAAGSTDIVSELALGWYTINEHGNLLARSPRTAWQRPGGWQDILNAAKSYGLDTEMVIHETNHGGLLTTFLNNEQAMSSAVAAIVEEAGLYRGVNLNLEGLGYLSQGEEQKSIRDSFTRFIALLAPLLRDAGKTFTLTIHPPNSVYRGYDYQALGKLADRIIVMAHDYGPKPEPLSRVVQAVEMALTVVPREKLVLAISAPSETAESITAKVGVAKRYRLQGISLWRLGLVTDGMWASLRQTIKTRR